MGTVAILSFRLGGTDGVSIVADRWATILQGHGWDIVTVAGEGPVDRTVAGLGLDDPEPPVASDLGAALADANLVIVENLLTIPMNLPASAVVAEVLRGRPALLHHHDPPWQRERFASVTALPVDDPAWRHVTINMLSESQFAERGIAANTIFNPFDTEEPVGDRSAERHLVLGAGRADSATILVSHPVRAIERKNIPDALAICESIRENTGRPVLYWLPGPAEEQYGAVLDGLIEGTSIPVLRTQPRSMANLYAASDLVVFPSTWEGFGNVPVEASIHRRPVVVGDYMVAEELRRLGFRWLRTFDQPQITKILSDPALYDEDALHNRNVAREYLSMKVVGDQMKSLFEEAGWSP